MNFERPNGYPADDRNHIGPSGGWMRSRTEVLKRTRQVHATNLKEAVDTIEDISMRFAARRVAVATVVSCLSPFTDPEEGARRKNERNFRTFVGCAGSAGG